VTRAPELEVGEEGGHQEGEKGDESTDEQEISKRDVSSFSIFCSLEDVEEVDGSNLSGGEVVKVGEEDGVGEGVGVAERSGPVPLIDVKVGLEVDGAVGEDHGGAKSEGAVFREGDGVEALGEGDVLHGRPQALAFGVVTGLIVVDQEAVISQGQDCFVEVDDVHLAESQGRIVILSVHGS